jgi:hypothetical protein
MIYFSKYIYKSAVFITLLSSQTFTPPPLGSNFLIGDDGSNLVSDDLSYLIDDSV